MRPGGSQERGYNMKRGEGLAITFFLLGPFIGMAIFLILVTHGEQIFRALGF